MRMSDNTKYMTNSELFALQIIRKADSFNIEDEWKKAVKVESAVTSWILSVTTHFLRKCVNPRFYEEHFFALENRFFLEGFYYKDNCFGEVILHYLTITGYIQNFSLIKCTCSNALWCNTESCK